MLLFETWASRDKFSRISTQAPASAYDIQSGTVVITGYNTDVEHKGVVYHVQTEDKGLDTPLILSLVYTGGAILASKRSPYDDLIAAGFNEKILSERLQRQHKLICAAIHTGRIEDLKRMGHRDAEPRAATENAREAQAKTPAPTETQTAPPVPTPATGAPPVICEQQPGKADFARAAAATGALDLSLLEEQMLRAGENVILRVRVSRGPGEDRVGVPDAPVTLKVLGTAFRPVTSSGVTDSDGIALIFAALPHFTTGRAAILLQTTVGEYEAELRRIIHPS